MHVFITYDRWQCARIVHTKLFARSFTFAFAFAFYNSCPSIKVIPHLVTNSLLSLLQAACSSPTPYCLSITKRVSTAKDSEDDQLMLFFEARHASEHK